MRLSQTNEWRAGCAERRKSGSVRGVEKRAVLWENQSWSQPKRRALLLLYGSRVDRGNFTPSPSQVGSRSGAVFRRADLSVALHFF